MIYVQRPDAHLKYTFDWSADIPEGISLVSVAHTVPSPLVIESEVTDVDALQSTVAIAGSMHGQTYLVTALATLSNGEQIPGEATLRGFNG